MSPRLEAGFRIAARWRLFTEPAVGPWDGRSPSLSRASRRLLLGRRLEWTSPLGTRRSRSMLSSTASGPDFPGGRLRARYRRVPQRSSNEPGTVARLELGLGLGVLYRRAFPQSSSDPGLYSAFNSRRGSRTLASAITCCAMSVARSRRPFTSLSLRNRGSRRPSAYHGGCSHLPRATVPPVDSAARSLLPRNPA